MSAHAKNCIARQSRRGWGGVLDIEIEGGGGEQQHELLYYLWRTTTTTIATVSGVKRKTTFR